MQCLGQDPCKIWTFDETEVGTIYASQFTHSGTSIHLGQLGLGHAPDPDMTRSSSHNDSANTGIHDVLSGFSNFHWSILTYLFED